MKTKLFKSINLIRRGSGASLNLFRYAAKLCDSQGVVTATSYGASDEHPMSIRSASDGSTRKAGIWKYAAMVLVLLTIGVGNAWAHSTHNGKVTFYNATGNGTVYLSTASGSNSGEIAKSSPESKNGYSQITWSCGGSSDKDTKTLYPRGTVAAGYYYLGWSTSSSATSGYSTGSLSANASSDTDKKIYGYFETIKVTAAPADVTINPTDPSATYPDPAGVVVGFTTSSSNSNSDFTTGGSGDSRWTISVWPTHASATSTTFNYKFVGNGSYGTNNRTLTKTVTLKGLNDATVKTCTLTAKYPNPRVVACDEVATDLTIYPTFKAADATQEAFEKTAVFDVVYADNANNFTAAFSSTTGSGAWDVTGISVDQANQKATVTYTFNGNKAVGTHTAVLTLTANDCKGWDDTSADGGASATITLTAENTQEATNDASVTTTANVTTEYATFAEALAAANATSGATLKLLRNVDLGTFTATKTINKAMTIDLNGKELRAAVNKSEVPMLTFSASVTVKDSKTGGKIINEHALNGQLRTITVSGGTFTLESGTIAVNNLAQYASAKNADLGVTATLTGNTSRVIHQNAGTTVNINGGKLDAKGTRSVYGIVQASSAATNAAGTTVLNVTGGEIAVEAPYNALGIYAYGKVNMSAGVINTHITTNLIDAGYAADHGNNTNNGYGYGILMKVLVSATASSCYYGTLNMTGGTINVISDRTKAASLYNYGIYLEAAATGVGAGKTATDGTLSQKASAKASIENANITVHSNTYYSYGIIVYGSYNSYDNEYFTVPIKNCNIDVQAYLYTYAICANAAVNSTYGGCYWGDVELTGNTVTAESVTAHTAHAVYVLAATAHIFKDANTTTAPIYYGEYATAAKAVINNGTYTAKTKTSTAYAVCSSARAKTIYDSETQVQTNRKPGGNAEAYPIVIIHGGTFRGEATTTTSRAVSSGGYTTIDGGTFEAFSTSTTAYGLYAISGKLTASGATISASATGTAYGAFADCGDLPAGNTAQTGFAYAAEMELNNCDITATTRTSTEARGVSVNAKNKMHNWKQFQADSTSNKWATTTYNAYKSVFPCTIAGRDSVGIAIAAKATINGCDIKVTAGTTTAYGVYSTATSVPASADSVASPIVNIKNSKFTVKTNGTTTAYGVYAGGPTTIDGCDFTVQPKSTTAYGVYVYDKKTTITNTKFDVKGTTTAHGIYANAAIGSTTGWDYHGEVELGEGNDMTVAATSGDAGHVMTLIATKKNVASGRFAGDYANAASAHVTGGTYKATATGAKSYVLNLSDRQVQGEAISMPSCTIEEGKFWALASGGTTGICTTNGQMGSIQFKGGVYNVNTNLSTYIPDGYEEVLLTSERPEYTEGYSYEVDEAGMHGIDVCKIGSTKYKTLEEALQVVKSGETIIMIANYTMATPGDYVLPAGATLLVPYSGQTGAKTTSLERVYGYTKPAANLKLSFGAGVNLDVLGTIEAGSKQAGSGQTGGYNGAPHLSYGWIYLAEGSTMTLENGAKLFAWGYVTGTGEIDAKRGSTVYEMFQLTDWRGGTAISGMEGNSQKVMPVNQYYIQNVECPIKFRPGAVELCEGSCNMSSSVYPVKGKNASTSIQFIGITGSGSLFMMDDEDVSNDTWVRKRYDAVNDKQVYEINSSAKIGGIDITCANLPFIGSKTLSSTKYVMPITNNMKIHLLSGSMYITQNLELAAGAEIEVDKEATAYVNSGVSLYVFDIAEWDAFAKDANGNPTAHTYPVSYTPSWSTCPRSKVITQDAAINVHGKFVVNGNLYTTSSGANIFSTNEDAGTVTYSSNVSTSSATVYVCNNTSQTYNAKTCYPAWLQNGEGITPAYSETAGTAAGKTWSYYDDKWQCWTQSGCFTYDAQNNNPYIKPAAYVQVTSNQPDANKLHHDAETGSRNFVWDENCYWWEVVTEPTAEGYYRSINADHNGKYNYYYYDSSAGCWKIKKITVTWNINGSTTDYSVGYGTKPEWLDATPTKTSSSSNYVWRWDGWTQGSSTEVIDNKELPIVTENTTFTAHFYEKYYEYNIIFKNSDGTILDSRNWRKGDTPSYDGTPTKNPTAAETFEFNGTWTPAIATVSGSATYEANYTSHPRAYTITFLNYDMSPLGSIQVNYGTTPSHDTYKAAIAPSDFEPYKPDNNAYSFVFDDWRLNGASSNGFAQVKGDQTYVAQYEETTKKYRIEFVDNDGETLLHWTQLEYGAMAAYDGPATSGFDKQEVEWNYTFTGWTPATFSEVQGPQTYTAVYDKTKRKYDITWKDGNGNTLKTDQVAYGETPAYSGSTPTKTSTNTQNFTFNNTWSPAITAVTGEETYTAQFNATERKYQVTWDANSGTCGTAYTDFSYNAAIGTLPSASKTGYTFNGWFTSATGGTQITTSTKVTADVTYHAQFAPNPYTITFNSNGGSSVASITQNYGTTVTAPADPIREGYTFKGWSPAVPNTMPLNGTTCVAQWTINQYTITFDSKGGSDVASITQNYGTAVTAPADPTREGYTFNGWNPDVPKTMPANGAACIAQWTANPHTPYTVKHYKQKLDGSYAATPDETDYLDGPTDASVTPARKNYAGFTAPAGQTVTILANGSRVVEYQYTRNNCNLSWSANGGNELTGNYTTGSVKYGATITAPNDPTRTGYSFSGWSPAYTGTMPATNTEYQAQWTPEKRTVTWKDGTTTIKIEEWNYDSKPSFNYVKTPTAQYSFPLLKWEDEATGTQYDPDNLPLINADVTYKAIYGNVTNKYTIRFVNDGGTELQVINDIPYGDSPEYTGETPASEIHDYYIREFKGWSPEIVEVEGHTTYTARYEIVAKLEIKEEYVVPTNTIVETTTVEVGGSLNVASEKKLTTTDLIIESSADEDWNEVTSGEVVAVESAISANNAYYDMKPAGGYKARIWYAVAVPWTVDVPTGVAGHVYDANGRALRLDIDFDLLYYDGAQRAAGGTNNWRYVAQEEAENQVMKPGKAYMIYLASPTSKLRFEKSTGNWLTKELPLEHYAETTGNDGKDANWNGIANPAIYRAYLNAGTDGNWGQVFVPGSAPRDGGTYAPVDMSTYKLAVGQPIFVQANTEKETVVAYQSNTDYTNHAPRRAQADAAEQEARYAVEIAVNGKRGDRIFIATDEDKEDVYTIGRDVVKMGLSNTKPQMWINRYDSKLCVNTIEFNGTTAVYPLTIQIPTEGEYSLYTPSDILTGHELYLTYNGRSIWNLRYAPYVDTFTAGTHAEYGLKLVRSNMPTDIDQTGAEQKNVRKMIVDDHVYIIRGNNVYTVDGQLVK